MIFVLPPIVIWFVRLLIVMVVLSYLNPLNIKQAVVGGLCFYVGTTLQYRTTLPQAVVEWVLACIIKRTYTNIQCRS